MFVWAWRLDAFEYDRSAIDGDFCLVFEKWDRETQREIKL